MMTSERGIGIVDLARAAEERGFDSLYVPEHTHLPVRRSEPPALVGGVTVDDYKHSLDPYVALGAAAAVTRRILLGTGIALIGQHDPIVLAKAIATVDQLSGGRFVLGFGYGWNREEMADHRIDFGTRRELVHEKLLCMRALWSQEEAEFHGELVELPPAYSWPKPVQQPGVRTLLGGAPGPKLFGAIARYCDGWMPVGGAGLGEQLPVLRAAFEEAGRDPSLLEVVPFGTIPSPPKLGHYRDLGVTEVVLRLRAGVGTDGTLRELDDYAQYLRSAAA
jgi:probable F420-dependent oxidoreductase